MAKIVLNDTAPKDAKSFALAGANFEVPYETTDAEIVSNAVAHPWLEVQFPEVESFAGSYRDTQVNPADDAFSAQNSKANDPEAVRAALAEEDSSTPLAVDAGLDQNKAKTVGSGDGKVAVTLAADETDSTGSQSRSRRSTEDKD